MSGDSLKISSMQSRVPWILWGQALGQPANEKPFLVLPVGFPTGDGKVLDKKKLPQRTSHFSRVKSIHAAWKLLPCERIYSGFCCKMFSVN